MATDKSAPKIRVILTVAFSSVVILVVLNYVFRSYFLMMTEQVESDHLATPTELLKLHAGEERNLTTSPLPIAQAMKDLATRGRDQYADIKPEPSTDMGAMVGWLLAPNQAVIDAMSAADTADAGSPAVANATDAGVPGAGAAPDAGVKSATPHRAPVPHSGAH
jgi:hypothetical protein